MSELLVEDLKLYRKAYLNPILQQSSNIATARVEDLISRLIKVPKIATITWNRTGTKCIQVQKTYKTSAISLNAPKIWYEGRCITIHRVLMILRSGIPNEGYYQCVHMCANTFCINPDHLAWSPKKYRTKSSCKKVKSSYIGIVYLSKVNLWAIKVLIPKALAPYLNLVSREYPHRSTLSTNFIVRGRYKIFGRYESETTAAKEYNALATKLNQKLDTYCIDEVRYPLNVFIKDESCGSVQVDVVDHSEVQAEVRTEDTCDKEFLGYYFRELDDLGINI